MGPVNTTVLGWDVPRWVKAQVARRRLDWAAGLHAVEQVVIGLLPLFAMCDRWEIGGLSTPKHPDMSEALVFIYDGLPGGVGLAEKGFELLEALSRWCGGARARRGVRGVCRVQSVGTTMSRWTRKRW